jgi:hypothetical protein
VRIVALEQLFGLLPSCHGKYALSLPGEICARFYTAKINECTYWCRKNRDNGSGLDLATFLSPR